MFSQFYLNLSSFYFFIHSFLSFFSFRWFVVLLCCSWSFNKNGNSGFRGGMFPGKPESIILDHWCLLGGTWKKYSKSTIDKSSRPFVKHVLKSRGPEITLMVMGNYTTTDDTKGNSQNNYSVASSWCLSPHPAEPPSSGKLLCPAIKQKQI